MEKIKMEENEKNYWGTVIPRINVENACIQ
jgi:hypothetical protein